MPQVPLLAPSTQPSGYVPEVGLPVPVDAFGGAVGHALEGLGGQIEQSSDKIWQRAVEMQGIKNETEAKEADAKYMMESGKLHADFINKQGVDAGPEALSQHIQQLQDLRTSIRGNISNPAAQRMYDSSSLGFMGRNIFNAAGHSGQQVKVSANNASDARIEMAMSSIGQNPDDSINVARMQRVIQTEVEAKGRNSGWTQEQIDATKQQKVSEGVAHQILGIAKTNAAKAQRMLDFAVDRGAMTDKDAGKIQATVQTQFRDQGSRIIADTVLAGRRNGDEENIPVQDYIDRAMEEAKKYPTKDPLFTDYVRSRVVSQYNQQKAIETDADNADTRIIGQAMLKANNEGVSPTSIEELKAVDPSVEGAWDRIARNPAKQQAFMKQFERNAIGGHIPVTPENLQMYHNFRGQAMAGSDDERASFMAHNFAVEGKMTVNQRNQLMNLQDQLKHRAAIAATDDPRTARAIRYLKPDMEAAGIDPKGSEDARKDYYTFIGSLQDQLDQYQKDHPGKVPTHEELRSMGAQLMQEQHTHWWQSSQKFFQIPAPDEDLERLRNDPYWKKVGATPNDAMLNRIYRAQQFRERYGGAAKQPAQAQFPPNNPE